VKVSNWGNYPSVEAEVHPTSETPDQAFIPRAMGRSYGDAALEHHILDTRILKTSFELEGNLLITDAGSSLKEILEFIVPEGFFLPVSPGTKFISVGGAIASDIHGKNHHSEGSFGKYVEWIDIENSDGSFRASKTENQVLFHSTIGGMGLTGVIKRAAIKLKKIETSLIDQEVIKLSNLTELLKAFKSYNSSTYSVAWIDCLSKGKSFGRSILFLGEHAKTGELKIPKSRKLNIPFFFPSFSLNNLTIRIFNSLYFTKNKAKKDRINYDTFFYPLDGIGNWNRIYGKNGFTQYQFVIPFEKGDEALLKIIQSMQEARFLPFLTVLKTLGDKTSKSPLSFPIRGYTLALDFKIRKGLFEFLNELDKIVIEYGGRVYLTKDCRLPKAHFEQMYNWKNEFFGDPKHSSLLAKRIGLR